MTIVSLQLMILLHFCIVFSFFFVIDTELNKQQ